MRKFLSELNQTDKQKNIERQARVNEFIRLQTLQKITKEDIKHAQIKTVKRELLQKQRAELKNSLIRKHTISDAMDQMRITNDFSMLDKLFASAKANEKKNAKTGKPTEEADGEENKLAQTI